MRTYWKYYYNLYIEYRIAKRMCPILRIEDARISGPPKKEWFLKKERIYGNNWWKESRSKEALMLRKTNHHRKVFSTFNIVPFLHELYEKDAKAARDFYGL